MSARVKCGEQSKWSGKCKASPRYRITVRISERGGDSTPRRHGREVVVLRCEEHKARLPFHGAAIKTEIL